MFNINTRAAIRFVDDDRMYVGRIAGGLVFGGAESNVERLHDAKDNAIVLAVEHLQAGNELFGDEEIIEAAQDRVASETAKA